MGLEHSDGSGGSEDGEESMSARSARSGLEEACCTLTIAANGALCGRGERSMGSLPMPGEDEGSGGVVVPSVTRHVSVQSWAYASG